jgi:outer membrane protein assembly factor BamB
VLVGVALVASLLVGSSGPSTAQAAECVRATNAEHATAGRATSFLFFVWAAGSDTYLGLSWETTSLRSGPAAGSWARVDTCDAGPGAAEWPHVGLDLANTRAALTETEITPANVGTLGRVWEMADVEGVSGTPVVAGGTLYVGDWAGQLHALDPATGQERWAQDVGGQVPGSVAVDADHVYAGTWDGRLVARDRATGAAAWEVEVDTHDVAVVYGSPVAVDGKVIVGVSSDEWWEGDGFTFRGSVVAYDGATGDEVWRYWTSCGPENAGRDNCPAGAAEGAGVGVWAYPAVDTARDLVFFGTGNHYGAPATNRSDALIAVDLATGAQRWAHQFTPGDIWNLPDEGDPEVDVGPDADVLVASLFQVGGVDAVGVGDKAGTYKAVNRETGAELWEATLTAGSIQGGVMASAAVVDAAAAGTPEDVLYLTSNRGGQNAEIFALDAADGGIVRRADVGGNVVSPATWANGLVYVADNTGRISAFDDGTLERVWAWDTAAPAAGGISIAGGIVYGGWGWALNGESPAGGLLAFGLGGDPPGDPGPEEPDGEAIYQANCASCHGADGSGGNGPPLQGIGDVHTIEELVAVITEGRGGMPAWRDELTPEEIEAVAGYVATIPGEHEHDHAG